MTELADKLAAISPRCSREADRETIIKAAQALRGVAQAAVNPAAQFVMWCLMEGCWQGDDVDGGAAQDKAEALGLIVQTQYDPAKHGENPYCEPGDGWYVPSPALLAMLGDTSVSSTDRAPAPSAWQPIETLGYRLDHPMHGTEMSIHQPDDDWANRGWVVTPLYASLVSSPLRSSAPQGDGRAALRTAIGHIEHMAAFITKANSDYHCGTYSFESLGEDMPSMKAALSAPPSVALEALEDAAEWCAVRRAEIGAVDGYDYRSGEEFGLRRAEIELRRQAKETLTRPQPGGAVAGTERGGIE